MDEKIAFFGASVTQQKNGYSKCVSNILNVENNTFGYGSMHLCDAGICYIDDIIMISPRYIFVDWFSTGYIEYNKDNFDEIKVYINTIIHKCLRIGIIPIFLIFPDYSINSITNNIVNKTDIYLKIKNYLYEIDVPVIDLSQKYNETEMSLILRDGIHTTDYGSQVYAQDIVDSFLENIYKKYKIPFVFPEKTKFDVVSTLDCELEVKNFITLKGPCEVIGISQIIGPYSGLIKINDTIVNNWDRWCYYERPMIKHKFIIDYIVTIYILDEQFDYTTCEHQANFNIKKMLNLKRIFYSGNNLEIINYE